MYVYALKLEGGKYYIGTSLEEDPPTFESIRENYGNSAHGKWVEMHHPIGVQEIRENCELYDDVKCMMQYMNTYGVENVRGSMLPNVDFINPEMDFLRRLVYTPAGKCHTCGASNHFVEKCQYNVWNQLQRSCFICKNTFHSMDQCPLRAPTTSPYLPQLPPRTTKNQDPCPPLRKSFASMIFDKLYDLIFDRASTQDNVDDSLSSPSPFSSSSSLAHRFHSEEVVDWVRMGDHEYENDDDPAMIDSREYETNHIE